MNELRGVNHYLWRYKWHLLGGVLFVAISNFFAIFPAQVIRFAIDFVQDTLVIYPLFDNSWFESSYYAKLSTAIIVFSVIVIVLALLKGFFLYLMRQTIIVMSRLIEFDQKNDLFNHYQKLHMGFYKENNTGDLMNRISEDVSRVRMYMGPAIMYTLNLIVLFIMVVVTMIGVNPTLTAFVLIPLPFLSLLIYWVSAQINERSERVQAKLSDLSSFVQEAFSGIRVIKAYNRLAERERRFSAESDGYRDVALELVRVNALFMPAMVLLIGLSTVITIYVGGRLTISGSVSPGNIAEFVIYVNMLTWPVASVGWVTSLVQRAAASQKRINEFMQTAPEIVNQNTADTSQIQGDIEFRNVSFTYANSGIQALTDVSFKVGQGSSLAIIGSTGSGKSTIANLICRLYDPTSGEVLIDGRPLTSVNLDTYRASIGYVPQEVYLFSDTVENNIAFSGSHTRQQIVRAATDAAVHDNILAFEQGYETRVGERGVTLSGGQKQRVSIARALIKNPQILLLDDCLSAVDTETEEQILTSINGHMAGKTTIIISHRVSSVRHCHEILVLHEGRIAERGSHAELLAKRGIYHEVHERQQLESMSVS